jgi:hypothetical protein
VFVLVWSCSRGPCNILTIVGREPYSPVNATRFAVILLKSTWNAIIVVARAEVIANIDALRHAA